MRASLLRAYLPTVLGMGEGENVVYVLDPGDYAGRVLFFFENGKAARVELAAYQTKTFRKKLTGAYSGASPLVSVLYLREDAEVAVIASDYKAVVFSTALLAPKSTRTTLGVSVMTLKKNSRVVRACFLSETAIQNVSRYRVRNLPAAGSLLKDEDRGERQLTLEDLQG